MCLCITACVFIACVMIGIPCIIFGCNEMVCFFQEKVSATVDTSYYSKDTCLSTSCISYNANSICNDWSYDEYDCSYWTTYAHHSKGICSFSEGPYSQNESIEVFVNKRTGHCTSRLRMTENIAIVGIVFCSLAGLIFVSSVIGITVELYRNTVLEARQDDE